MRTRKKSIGTPKTRERFVHMLSVLLNSNTINPFQNVITVSDLATFMLKYYENRYPEAMREADIDEVMGKISPRVFGKQFGFILKDSREPFKMIDIISLKRGLVYKFNFTKLRQHMEKFGLYDITTESPRCRSYLPSYLSIVQKPCKDPQLMDRLYCDFLLYDFIRNKNDDNGDHYGNWRQNPPKMIFISVLAFSSEMSMSSTETEISKLQALFTNLDPDEAVAVIKISATDLFKQFINFLHKLLELGNDALNFDVASQIKFIICGLNVLHFGADMERFLFASELGLKKRSNGKIVYHVLMDKIKQFLSDKLNKQRDIQFKQMDIQSRTPNQEYEDFTDPDSTIDEEKDSAERQRRTIKRMTRTYKMGILRKRRTYGKKNSEDYEKNEALRNWEQEDIEDRTNGINGQEKADVIKHLHSFHLVAQRRG